MTYLERAYPWLLLAPSALPLVVLGGVIYPYLVPKMLLFYALSLVSIAAFAVLAASGRSFYFGRLRSWTAYVPLALLALAYLASFAGIDFYRSFWSLYIRGDGLLMMTSATAYFYLILLYADRTFFVRLAQAVALVGTIVAIYGIGEWLLEGGRIGSLLGNAAFFAGYLDLAFFITLIAARYGEGLWQRAAYIGAALQLVAIILSATRGTLVALALAAVATLVYLAWRGHAAWRGWSAGALIALVALGGLFFIFRENLAQIPFEPIQRVASIGTKDPNVASRLFIWEHMIEEIKKAPFLGVGAEHIDTLFNRFYDPSQIREEWFDRSHNAFLDYAAQYGVGGLLLFLALIGLFFLAAWRLKAQGNEVVAGLVALFAMTYAVQNFFVFDTVSSFWLLLAALAALLAVSGRAVSARSLVRPNPLFTSAGSLVAVVLIALIWPVSARPAIAAYDLARAYAYAVADPDKEIAHLAHGYGLSTYGNLEYGYQVYDMYAAQSAALVGGDRVAAYQAAFSILSQNYERFPYDARTALYLAHLISLAPPEADADTGLLAEALARAIEGSPKRAQPWYVLVNLSLSRANEFPPDSDERAAGYAAARDLLARYIALVPELAEPHFVLAELHHAAGDAAKAADEAELGKAHYREHLATARRAATYFAVREAWEDARFFYAEVVRLDSSDTASYFNLAKVAYLGGDPASAAAIVADLRERDPEILATDPDFLAAIASYERSGQ